MSDAYEDVAARAMGGDAEAFAWMIERHERAALAVAFAYTSNAEAAADAVQEGCLRAWKGRRSLKVAARFAPWFVRIVRNVAAEGRRKSRELVVDVPERDGGSLTPVEDASGREKAEVIRSALGKLDEMTRAAVMLRYYEDATSQQIGELLEMTPAAVDMRLSRARQELKRLLGPLVESGKVFSAVKR